MAYTKPSQLVKNIYFQQPRALNISNQSRGVRQDKRAFSRARPASGQPASPRKNPRAPLMEDSIDRSQKRPGDKKRTVQLTLWVKPIVKEELQRISKREGITVSAAGAAFLQKALQADLDMKYGALLEPVIQNTITQQMQSLSTRLALLLVRVAFAGEQTRSLVTNILGRQEGMTPQLLNAILDGSSSAARDKITASSPQLEDLIAEVQRWFNEKDGKR